MSNSNNEESFLPDYDGNGSYIGGLEPGPGAAAAATAASKRQPRSSTNKNDHCKRARKDDQSIENLDLTTVEGQLRINPFMSMEDAKFQAKRECKFCVPSLLRRVYNVSTSELIIPLYSTVTVLIIFCVRPPFIITSDHRQNAARARSRNKAMVDNLQRQVAALSARANSLERENDVLKAQLDVLMNHQQGAPAVPTMQVPPAAASMESLVGLLQGNPAAAPPQQFSQQQAAMMVPPQSQQPQDPNSATTQFAQMLANQMQQPQMPQAPTNQQPQASNFTDALSQLLGGTRNAPAAQQPPTSFGLMMNNSMLPQIPQSSTPQDNNAAAATTTVDMFQSLGGQQLPQSSAAQSQQQQQQTPAASMQPEAVPQAGNDPLSTFLVQQAQQELQIQPSKTDVSSTQAGGGLLVTLLAQQQEQQQQSSQAVASGPQAGGDLLATLLAQQQQSQPGASGAQTGGDLMAALLAQQQQKQSDDPPPGGDVMAALLAQQKQQSQTDAAPPMAQTPVASSGGSAMEDVLPQEPGKRQQQQEGSQVAGATADEPREAKNRQEDFAGVSEAAGSASSLAPQPEPGGQGEHLAHASATEDARESLATHGQVSELKEAQSGGPSADSQIGLGGQEQVQGSGGTEAATVPQATGERPQPDETDQQERLFEEKQLAGSLPEQTANLVAPYVAPQEPTESSRYV